MAVRAYREGAVLTDPRTGTKLKAAKKRLTAASCELGKVTKKNGATRSSGKVKQQSPKAGKSLAAGAKVKVTLAP